MLFVHHPPIAVGAWWLDKDRLKDREALRQLFESARTSADLRGMFTGHVHQETEAPWGGVPVRTTPAVAYPFRPRARVPGMDSPVRPAFRVIDQADGALSTRIIRL